MSITDDTKAALRSWFVLGYNAAVAPHADAWTDQDAENAWQRAWADYAAWARESGE